jgi:hypothetical protein
MVARAPSQSQPIGEYRKYFPEPRDPPCTTVQANGKHLNVHTREGAVGSRYVGVFDGSDLIAVVNLWSPDENVGYRNIGRTLVEERFQGNRITRQIIEWWVITKEECLASDEDQTDDGARVWESMILRDPILNFCLWRLGQDVIPIIVRNGDISPDPWAENQSRLIACPPTTPCNLA